jgi:hypothetical protein
MNFSISEIAPYLLVAVVVLINIALWASLRSRATQDQFDMLRKAGKTLQKPWEKEDRAMRELSEKVKEIKPGKNDIQNDDDD